MACDSCPFRENNAYGPVKGRWVGPENGSPILMVVGDLPNLNDDIKQKSFTGSRGHLVDDIIRKYAPNARVWYTYVVGCRVEDKNVLKKLPQQCMDSLEFDEVLNEVNPERVLLLGAIPLKAVLGKAGIMEKRGNTYDYKGYDVMPTVSTGAVARNASYLSLFTSDVTKFALGASLVKYPYNYVYVNTKDAFKQMIRDLKKQKDNIEYVALDFETTTFDYWRPETKIMSVGICVDGKTCYGIPLSHKDSPWKNQVNTIVKNLKPFFCNPDIPVVGNNWKFDQKYARAKLGVTVNFKGDNMLIDYANDENTPHGLKYQADLYCNAGHYDSDIKWPDFNSVKDDINNTVEKYDSMDLVKLCKYNALDAFYSWNVYPIVYKKLCDDERVKKIYDYLLEPGSNMFVRIEEQGMWIDPDRLEDAYNQCKENIETSLELLNSLIPEGWVENNLSPKQIKEGFNWNSTKQLGMLFFQEDGFNFPVLSRTATGAPSTAEAVIVDLAAEVDHPALKGLLEYRKWAKYMSTYLLPWKAKVDSNSRLHPTFLLHGTVTGRLSGKDGVHQVPRDNFIRRLIGAPPGWTFFEIDGSQIELRVAAAIANEPTMIRVYATGGDIHRTTAAAVAHKKPEEITSAERKKAKAVNFGFLYGMGWRKFKEYSWQSYGVKVTDQEAKLFRERFFELYHELPEWHKRMKRIARKLGYVVSPIGRKRRLPDVFSDDEKVVAAAEREAVNSPVQGFGSDYVLAAFIEMFSIIEREDPEFTTIRPVGTVHDAQYYEIRNDKLEYWATKIKRVFDDASRLDKWFGYTPPLAITGDCKIGNHWGDAKDWEIGQPVELEER